MTTVTKESLEQKILQLEKWQKIQAQRGNSLSISEEYQLQAYKMLLRTLSN